MFSKKQRDRVEEMEPYATFIKKYNKLSNPINQKVHLILSILVDTFISKISLPMQPVPEIGSISDA